MNTLVERADKQQENKSSHKISLQSNIWNKLSRGKPTTVDSSTVQGKTVITRVNKEKEK